MRNIFCLLDSFVSFLTFQQPGHPRKTVDRHLLPSLSATLKEGSASQRRNVKKAAKRIQQTRNTELRSRH